MLKLPTSQINNLTRCLRNSLKLQVPKVDFEVVFAEREKERLREREHNWTCMNWKKFYIHFRKIFLYVSLSFNVTVKKMRLIEFAERKRNQVIKHPEIFRALTAFLPTHIDYWVYSVLKKSVCSLNICIFYSKVSKYTAGSMFLILLGIYIFWNL